MSKMVKCSHCGAEIAAGAKACPKCGGKNKKPIYKRWWFIAAAAVVLIAVIASVSGNSGTNGGSTEAEKATEAEIVYTDYGVEELMNDLDANALNAAEKYKGQYVSLTGRLSVIDSSGKYISIFEPNNQFAITGVQCYIKNDEQRAKVSQMAIGDIVVIKGKITDVGEVLGYSLDITEIE